MDENRLLLRYAIHQELKSAVNEGTVIRIYSSKKFYTFSKCPQPYVTSAPKVFHGKKSTGSVLASDSELLMNSPNCTGGKDVVEGAIPKTDRKENAHNSPSEMPLYTFPFRPRLNQRRTKKRLSEVEILQAAFRQSVNLGRIRKECVSKKFYVVSDRKPR